MLLFRKPSAEVIDTFLKVQSKYDLTYREVGATAGEPPGGYVVDRTRVKLGEGETAFVTAKGAVERWDQLRLGWVDIAAPQGPARVGDTVAIIARFGRIWWLNACRVVALVDDHDGPVRRFGLAYGTLPDHAAVGEERFFVEWDRATDEVSYSVVAFSRPNLRLARLGYFFMRKVQRHFGKVSAAAMIAIVKGTAG